MNPWEQKALDRCRSVLRFSLWTCCSLIGLMACLFAIAFSFEFLFHLWRYCQRALFDRPW